MSGTPWHCNWIKVGAEMAVVCEREDLQAEVERLRELVDGLVQALESADFDTARVTPEFEGWGGLIADSETDDSLVSVVRCVAEHLVNDCGWEAKP